jgi:hypothetical protein
MTELVNVQDPMQMWLTLGVGLKLILGEGPDLPIYLRREAYLMGFSCFFSLKTVAVDV